MAFSLLQESIKRPGHTLLGVGVFWLVIFGILGGALIILQLTGLMPWVTWTIDLVGLVVHKVFSAGVPNVPQAPAPPALPNL